MFIHESTFGAFYYSIVNEHLRISFSTSAKDSRKSFSVLFFFLPNNFPAIHYLFIFIFLNVPFVSCYSVILRYLFCTVSLHFPFMVFFILE